MSKHLKRLAAPRVLRLHRKERAFTIRAAPGPHPLELAIPLGLVIRDYLSLCDTYKEARKIVSNGDILVDGVKRKNIKFPCGLMDVISIPKMRKNVRILFDRNGKLTLVPISESDAEWKLCRIQNKTIVKGKKVQLNLHDGKNKLVEKDEYKTGDVLKISFKENKIDDVYRFDKGTVSMIIGGTHIGEIASIDEIQVVTSSKPNLAKMKGEKEFSTIAEHVFPIGKTKPAIALPEVKMQ
ncbi:MAG: 30S ribosomal protein S4e [Thermoplasmata archaeon]|nr:30S ribosomal protein S4e [Thermoplasmata archaeon]MBE3137295.1 30S ribosomal protein S4e [Thermoplasmata archaeon]MBE3141759.1 30S ribosomal protein S4e [Thermoplasmata archaeon]